MSKLYGLVVRWLFVSTNGIKMQYLGVFSFKSSTLTVYCLNSWFVHQKPKTYSNVCVLCWISNLSWFLGPKYIQPSFWPRVTNHNVKSKMSKSDFLGRCYFTQLFYDIKKLRWQNLNFSILKTITITFFFGWEFGCQEDQKPVWTSLSRNRRKLSCKETKKCHPPKQVERWRKYQNCHLVL